MSIRFFWNKSPGQELPFKKKNRSFWPRFLVEKICWKPSSGKRVSHESCSRWEEFCYLSQILSPPCVRWWKSLRQRYRECVCGLRRRACTDQVPLRLKKYFFEFFNLVNELKGWFKEAKHWRIYFLAVLPKNCERTWGVSCKITYRTGGHNVLLNGLF